MAEKTNVGYDVLNFLEDKLEGFGSLLNAYDDCEDLAENIEIIIDKSQNQATNK